MIRIYRNIEDLRKKHSLSQTEFSERLGIKQSAYSRMLRYHSDIKLSFLAKVAKVFDMSVLDVLAYPDEVVLSVDQPQCEQEMIHKSIDERPLTNKEYLSTLECQFEELYAAILGLYFHFGNPGYKEPYPAKSFVRDEFLSICDAIDKCEKERNKLLKKLLK